jgi:cytochrome b subunit of formate dehydrogenase
MIPRRTLEKATHWLLSVAIVLYVVSGYGISEFRVVERITFGLLSKQLAFRMHTILTMPFLVLLGLHIYFTYKRRSIPKE